MNPGHSRDSVVLWLPDWNSTVLMPLWRALSTDLELVVLKKEPQNTEQMHAERENKYFLAGKMLKQHARLYNQHFFIILVVL